MQGVLSRVSTMTFRLRHFISIIYPAQHLECIAFGASTNLIDHAMSTTTGVDVLVVSSAVLLLQML